VDRGIVGATAFDHWRHNSSAQRAWAASSFDRDGRAVINYGTGVTWSGSSNGHLYERTLTGSVSANYRVDGDQIIYTNVDNSVGHYDDQVDGKIVSEGDTGAVAANDTFSCSGDTLSSISGEWSATFVGRRDDERVRRS
jgi:hypothetical protein